MTFQEAQTAFSNIVSSIVAGMSLPALSQKQEDLQNLMNSLPRTGEFSPIVKAIAEFSPKLVGQGTLEALKELQSRDATFKEASGLLTQVSQKADADARTLTFEKPKLVAAALTESLTKLQELRAAAKSGKFDEAASKVDALVALVEHVRVSIKAS